MSEARVGRDTLEAIYRAHSRKVLATLIRLLGSFDAAEEALHDAFLAAAEQWPFDGVPANPYGWLVSAGRFRTISRWRRRSREAAARWPFPPPSRLRTTSCA
jgi:RNA polymerase sigma-70 factor (ECF subfamily)